MYGEPEPKSYKLDIPVEIRPKKSTIYTIINKGLFHCKRISIVGEDLENVVMKSMWIGKVEQLTLYPPGSYPPVIVFNHQETLHLDRSPPGGAITFRFRNNGEKSVKFTVQLDGQESPLL